MSTHKIRSASKRLLLHVLACSLLFAFSVNAEKPNDFFSQIQELQNQNNFQVIGLDRIQNRDKVLINGNLDQKIKQLFDGYNHVVSRDNKGRIERVVVINKKQKPKENRIVLPTSLKDNHHMVSVSLSGDGRVWQTLDMVIDTGADLVVLPESMIDQLGLIESNLTISKMQTANGIAEAKVSQLKELKIAGETVENVEVAFIADQLLGENRLLGMSVLGRFQVNIDDQGQMITLIRK
jgi:aspartyl protease family protein